MFGRNRFLVFSFNTNSFKSFCWSGNFLKSQRDGSAKITKTWTNIFGERPGLCFNETRRCCSGWKLHTLLQPLMHWLQYLLHAQPSGDLCLWGEQGPVLTSGLCKWPAESWVSSDTHSLISKFYFFSTNQQQMQSKQLTSPTGVCIPSYQKLKNYQDNYSYKIPAPPPKWSWVKQLETWFSITAAVSANYFYGRSPGEMFPLPVLFINFLVWPWIFPLCLWRRWLLLCLQPFTLDSQVWTPTVGV